MKNALWLGLALAALAFLSMHTFATSPANKVPVQTATAIECCDDFDCPPLCCEVPCEPEDCTPADCDPTACDPTDCEPGDCAPGACEDAPVAASPALESVKADVVCCETSTNSCQ